MPNVNIEDQSHAWYHHLISPTCPKDYHALVRGWLLNTYDDQMLAGGISIAIRSPKCHRDILRNLGAFIGPILVWATHQDWYTSIVLNRVCSQWCNTHFPRDPRLALSRQIVWLALVNSTSRAALLNHIILDTQQKIEWEYAPRKPLDGPQPEWVAALLLAEMIQVVEDDTEQKSLIKLWFRDIHLYGTTLTPSHQLAFSKTFIHSSIPRFWLLPLNRYYHPSIWLDAEVCTHLMPLLPFNETERANALPWASASTVEIPELDNGDVNRALMQLYCPGVFSTMDMIATSSSWKSREAILQLLSHHDASNSNEYLALPALHFEAA